MKTFFYYSLLQCFINNKIFGNNDYDTFTPFSIPLIVFLQMETPDFRRELEPTKIENFSVTVNNGCLKLYLLKQFPARF